MFNGRPVKNRSKDRKKFARSAKKKHSMNSANIRRLGRIL